MYNSLEDHYPLKGNTVGSRSNIENAYIAGFLDGDGSIMLQLKRRNDLKSGYRFMATICFYQDTRHEQSLFWLQNKLGAGYIAKRNDKITELRINGFTKIQEILADLQPFIRFKQLQTEAMIKACQIFLDKSSSTRRLSKDNLLQLADLIIDIQNANYKAHRKKTKEDILNILDLTP